MVPERGAFTKGAGQRVALAGPQAKQGDVQVAKQLAGRVARVPPKLVPRGRGDELLVWRARLVLWQGLLSDA